MSVKCFFNLLICFKSICFETLWLIIRSNRFSATEKKYLSNNVDLAIPIISIKCKTVKEIDCTLLIIDGILTI